MDDSCRLLYRHFILFLFIVSEFATLYFWFPGCFIYLFIFIFMSIVCTLDSAAVATAQAQENSAIRFTFGILARVFAGEELGLCK